jgi:hypothetical protein
LSEYENVESRHPIWKPTKKGEVLEGAVVDKGEAFTQQNASVQTTKGIFTTPAHVNLSGAVAQLQLGDQVRITFNGVIHRKGKNDYQSYLVQRKKAQ